MAESTKNDETGKRASAGDLTRSAKESVEDLTGFSPESVSGLQWDGETWLVTVDVCELERVPNTTDVLGRYEVTLDKDGELTGAQRTRRYHRAEAGDD